MVTTTGTVTYEDGTPIEGQRVVVRFYPQVEPVEGKYHPKPAQAEVDPDGKFDTLTTARWGDGVIQGTQKVVVQSLDGSEEPTGAVPREYHLEHTTPLEVTITADSEPLVIKVPRP